MADEGHDGIHTWSSSCPPLSVPREERAAYVLDAWAEAIRGDWGSIDGRTCRFELNEVSRFLRGQKDTLTFDDVGVCRCDGTTHWFGELWGQKCPDVAAEEKIDG